MTREEAVEKVRQMSLPKETMEILEALAPELRESEDERIRKELIEFIKSLLCNDAFDRYKLGIWIAYLERQKENPKSADFIPADCVSDAKCEDRWHKVGDSLPDNPREVLCKDEAGNYFIGRYYVGEGWEISNYDDEDKPHHLNPPVSKWIDFPSEKQKEQKPVEWSEEEVAELAVNCAERSSNFPTSSTGDQKRRWVKTYVEGFKTAVKKSLRPQPKREWSEEDEKIRQSIIKDIEFERNYTSATTGKVIEKYNEQIDWLKSLRPQWRPSEEQMEALKEASASWLNEKMGNAELLKSLHKDLNKLKGGVAPMKDIDE